MKNVLPTEIATRKNLLLYNSLMETLPDPDVMLSHYNNPIEHYKKLLNDTRVSGKVLQRKAFVKSMFYELDEKPLTKEISDMLDDLKIKEFINQTLDAAYFGYTVHEIVWQLNKGKFIPKSIDEKPQDWFAFNKDNIFKMKDPKNFNKLLDLPAFKFILSQNSPTYMNPYGEKVIKKCYWHVKFKASDVESWSYFVDKYGMPFLIGELPTSLYETKRDEYLASLVAMKKNGVMVKREGSKLELKESNSKQGSTSAYQQNIDYHNSCINEAILPVVTSNSDNAVGSYAKAKTEKDILEVIADGDKAIVEGAINKLIEYYCLLNYGKVDYPKISFFSKYEVDKELADRDKVLSDQGVKFTKRYYMESYNLKGSDFDLKSKEIVKVN